MDHLKVGSKDSKVASGPLVVVGEVETKADLLMSYYGNLQVVHTGLTMHPSVLSAHCSGCTTDVEF